MIKVTYGTAEVRRDRDNDDKAVLEIDSPGRVHILGAGISGGTHVAYSYVVVEGENDVQPRAARRGKQASDDQA